MDSRPGRGCPLSYRYGAQALAGPATLETDTLWVAGGLYGNRQALHRLLERFELLRGREDVRAAAAGVGRIEDLPVNVGGDL